MARFCVRCGKENVELIGPLCVDCYLETKELVETPKEISGKVCKICGSIWAEGKWVKQKDITISPVESVIYRELGRKVKFDPSVEEFNYDIVNQYSDPNGHSFVDIQVKGRVKGKEFRVIRTVSLRIDRVVCPDCIKKKSRYYEAIIQLRSKGDKVLSPEKKSVFESFLDREAIDSISDIAEGKEGVDYYFIKKSVARRVVSTFTSSVKDVKVVETYQDETIKNGKKFAKLVISVRV
ncbi:60S ribosomal export protein NMD3 [Stygiolobus caldivivus]|uniref:NMD protein affecting ribosome stability and mRNA decay n=1 Tax=Stygiolobus caldivivus TaxID=2824673 RepID=A0A8D5ZI66_9CREN|nr:60S ribosomal export protein NMD3 [Stygiolobus caldivivus]BCU69017.1 NMD protein affecting ribosome stability and mRNA decay [Stygiolobus caldivivus]